ncbi:adhesion G-protein coupled receptor G5 [Suncus etruscus]|uniref:adhesion G-protein coupled receptor G5 n=1 Tax=Suncus etruscus TaxID=109475 RepID=UPI002110B4E0|nr:adhesion G-protein coupled receptor G5 [Suncus etruscus]
MQALSRFRVKPGGRQPTPLKGPHWHHLVFPEGKLRLKVFVPDPALQPVMAMWQEQLDQAWVPTELSFFSAYVLELPSAGLMVSGEAGLWNGETSQDPQKLMERMEKLASKSKGRSRMLSPVNVVRDLEMSLLNISLQGSQRTFRTPRIQSLAFDLYCNNFTGLSLDKVRGAQTTHAMNFPAELTQTACQARPQKLRLICIYFFMTTFFQTENKTSLLNNYVLGAQLGHEHVHDLKESVAIRFYHNRSLEGYTATCVFWKEGASQRYWGTWSPEGCRTSHPSSSEVHCSCDHLSYFAVLMQMAPAPPQVLEPLTYISNVGCSISIVSSLLAAPLHFHTRKQGESLTYIHMNLHGSVLLLTITFLLSPMLATPQVSGALCKALGAILHCLLLSCFTWTAIEGFNLYILLGRVYNCYFRHYVLKLCVVGWGLPAFLVLLVLAIDSSMYGHYIVPLSARSGDNLDARNTSMCWVRSSKVRATLVIGYGGITCLFNLLVLGWALRTLRGLRARGQALGARARRDVVSVLGLTVLLGTSWTLGFFLPFGVFLVPQLFIFTIVNSLYGFFLSLWFCSVKYHSKAKIKTETKMETVSTSRITQ